MQRDVGQGRNIEEWAKKKEERKKKRNYYRARWKMSCGRSQEERLLKRGVGQTWSNTLHMIRTAVSSDSKDVMSSSAAEHTDSKELHLSASLGSVLHAESTLTQGSSPPRRPI